MKLILIQNVPKIGNAGDLVEVADGYARNFLLPRQLAIQATKGNMKRQEEIRRHQEHQREKAKEESKNLAQQIGRTSVTLSAKVGEEGKLFGSITAEDIARAVKEKIGKDLDKRKFELPGPIRHAGVYDVVVRLEHDVATVKLEVKGA